MSRLRLIADAVVDRLGYAPIRKWQLARYEMARKLRRILEMRDVTCVLDVGANIGQYGRFLRDEVGYRGIIVSFEPVPRAVSDLRRQAALYSNWLVEPIALSDKNGNAQLNITKGDEFSSFLEPDAASDFVPHLNTVVAKQTVPVMRLEDWAIKNAACLPLDRIYLKLDTQGFDLSVMEGAGSFVANIAAMQSEIPFRKLYTGVPDAAEFLARFRAHGFEPAEMFPTNHDEKGRAVEFDCLLVNCRA